MDGTFFIVIVLSYFIVSLWPLFFKKKRLEDAELTAKIDALRKISVKNLDKQKEFLALKENNGKKSVKSVVMMVFLTVLLMITIGKVLQYLNFRISFWTGLIVCLLFPVALNIFLHVIGLKHTSLLTYLGWKR